MDALRPSFMLLPDFAFLPDRDITLGRILPLARGTEQPNPRQPLTVAVPVVRDDVATQEWAPWAWDSDSSLSARGAVFADLSLVTGIGAGIDASNTRTNSLTVRCERVIQTSFRPTPAALAAVLADQTVSAILHKFSRRSVYVVTGLMVAHGADIEVKRGQGRVGGAHASADITQVGAPLKAGVEGEVSKSQNSMLHRIPKNDFILAYQLLRLRRRIGGSLDAREENTWALFNDDDDKESATDGSDKLMERVEIDLVTDEHEWGQDDA